MNVIVKFSGLIAYAISEQEKTIDALLLASGDGHGHANSHRGDVHVPALIVPLSAVKSGMNSPASDYVFDAGDDEYGVWLLNGVVLHVQVDDKLPDGEVDFTLVGDGDIPNYQNEDSLYWLPSIKKAANMACAFRPDCLPPNLNSRLVAAAVRLANGEADALWSTPEAKTTIYEFALPPAEGEEEASHAHATATAGPSPESPSSAGQKEVEQKPEVCGDDEEVYDQALADGITWSLPAGQIVELKLQRSSGRTRSIFLEDVSGRDVTVCISNKPATLNGRAVFEANPLVSHFDMFFDIVDPPPSANSRRVPKLPEGTTKTNRCPGSAG